MNTQKPLKSKVSITLDEDVIKRIKELAEADDRNFSQYINLVLKKHLEKTQQLKKVSLEAILKRFPSLVVAYPQVDFRSKKVLLMTVHKAMYGIDPILSEKIRLQDMAEKNKRTLILLDEQEHDVSLHEG